MRYLLQRIETFFESAPLLKPRFKVADQCPPLQLGGLVVSEWLPRTAWVLKLILLRVAWRGEVISCVKSVSIAPVLVLNRRPTTFCVPATVLAERTIEAMSPWWCGLAR